jgi:hypothetical protein
MIDGGATTELGRLALKTGAQIVFFNALHLDYLPKKHVSKTFSFFSQVRPAGRTAERALLWMEQRILNSFAALSTMGRSLRSWAQKRQSSETGAVLLGFNGVG